MVGNELAAHAQALRDRRGGRRLHLAEGVEDPEADVAVIPMELEEPVHLRLALGQIVARAAVRVPLVDDALSPKDVEVVASRADGELEGSCDRPQVVPGKETQVVANPTTHRMLQAHEETEADQERHARDQRDRPRRILETTSGSTTVERFPMDRFATTLIPSDLGALSGHKSERMYINSLRALRNFCGPAYGGSKA
jgi:hypothetical protein